MPLNDDEIEILEQAKGANPWYFQALLLGAQIVPQRRAKYSGKSHPFVNFEIAARIRNQPVDETFKWSLALKEARIEQDMGDFYDESALDTIRDWGNYVFLWLGYKLFLESQRSKKQ